MVNISIQSLRALLDLRVGFVDSDGSSALNFFGAAFLVGLLALLADFLAGFPPAPADVRANSSVRPLELVNLYTAPSCVAVQSPNPSSCSGLLTAWWHMNRQKSPRACLAYTEGPGNLIVYTGNSSPNTAAARFPMTPLAPQTVTRDRPWTDSAAAPVLLGRNVHHKLLGLWQSLQSELDLLGHCVRPELIQVAATVSFELGAHLESIWSNTVPRPQTAVQSR